MLRYWRSGCPVDAGVHGAWSQRCRAGMVLTFAHAVGEFGVVVTVGGNIPGVTRTLSIAIYDDVQALNYQAAGQMALLLVAFSFVVLCITYALQRRVAPL